MATKLYVGNLSFDTQEDDLRTLFATYGEVSSVTIVSDRYTGRSRGFGFVEMTSEEQAQSAVSGLNNKDFQGRVLKIEVARDKPRDRPAGGGGGFRRDRRD